MPFPADDRGECDCCHYADVPLCRHVVPLLCRPENGDTVLLCEVCYRSMAGTWYVNRRVHNETKVELARLIAWGINHLKDQPQPEA